MTEDEMRKLYRDLYCAAMQGCLAADRRFAEPSTYARTSLMEICLQEDEVLDETKRVLAEAKATKKP